MPTRYPAHILSCSKLAIILRHSFDSVWRDKASSYLRLSTRPLDQPERVLDATAVIKGAYWHQPPSKTSRTCIVYCGTVASEVLEAMAMFESQKSRPAVLAITSPDVLYQDWIENGVESYICELLSVLDKKSSIATVLDGHPSTLSWVGGCLGHRVISLGVSRFGQSGDCLDLFAEYGIDAKSIFNAVSSLK